MTSPPVIMAGPGVNLIEETARLIESDGNDYSATLVVFPGKRPAHYLRKTLGHKVGSGFVPPIIHSADSFIDYVYDSVLGFYTKRADVTDAVAILYKIHKATIAPLGGGSFLKPEAFFPLGIELFTALEEIKIENVRASILREIDPLTDDNKTLATLKTIKQDIAFFYKEFYKTLGTLSYATRSVRYNTVSEKIDGVSLDSFKSIIFAGFYALTKSETKIFNELSTRANVTFIFKEGPGVETTIAALNLKVTESIAGPAEGCPDIAFYKSPDTHGQVFALGSIIRASGSTLDEKNVIVLPSAETLFPVIRQALTFLSESDYNVSMGYPLKRTPIYGFFMNLIQLITSMDDQRVYVPDYLSFVLHPYTKNVYFNTETVLTRIMFHTIEEALAKQRTRNFMTLEEIEGSEEAFDSIAKKLTESDVKADMEIIKAHLKAIHDNTVRRFIVFTSVSDFATKCKDVLKYIYTQSTAFMHPYFHPFAESFTGALQTLGDSLLKDFQFSDVTGYFMLFKNYMATRRSPFEGTPLMGLQVLGFLETRALAFDQVFILDANEDVLPAVSREDSLLPHKARLLLGLPTYQAREQMSYYYFMTLLGDAAKVHIFYVENDRKEKSRFVERLLWERQKAPQNTVKNSDTLVTPIQYNIQPDTFTPPVITKTTNIIEILNQIAYSATSLDKYLKCSLKFYYTYVLNLVERHKMTREIEKADIGLIVHSILSEYFKRYAGKTLTESVVDLKRMDECCDAMIASAFGAQPTGTSYLLKLAITERMRDFLLRYLLPLLMGNTVELRGVEEQVFTSYGNIKLKGRIDWVEIRNGRLTIVDFKTAASDNMLKINFDKLNLSDRASWPQVIGSLQLPFYMKLYSEKADPASIDAMFLLLGRSDLGKDGSSWFCDQDSDKAKHYSDMDYVITSLIDEIRNPAIPFKAVTGDRSTCTHCEYAIACGRS